MLAGYGVRHGTQTLKFSANPFEALAGPGNTVNNPAMFSREDSAGLMAGEARLWPPLRSFWRRRIPGCFSQAAGLLRRQIPENACLHLIGEKAHDKVAREVVRKRLPAHVPPLQSERIQVCSF